MRVDHKAHILTTAKRPSPLDPDVAKVKVFGHHGSAAHYRAHEPQGLIKEGDSPSGERTRGGSDGDQGFNARVTNSTASRVISSMLCFMGSSIQ